MDNRTFVFIDRDGTMGGPYYVKYPTDYYPYFAAEFRDIGAYDWFICPHDSHDHCRCRKPESGLFEQAVAKYDMDLSKCYMIGDRWSDMAAAGKMGIKLILVMTGRGEEALGIDREKWQDYEPVYVAENMMEAVQYIIQNAAE